MKVIRYSTEQKIQQQLDPAMKELMNFGFLASWTIHKTKKEFDLTFQSGSKWFTDQKRMLERNKQRKGKSIVDRGDDHGMAILESDQENARRRVESKCRPIGNHLRVNRIIE
jgi:hypothetical protein